MASHHFSCTHIFTGLAPLDQNQLPKTKAVVSGVLGESEHAEESQKGVSDGLQAEVHVQRISNTFLGLLSVFNLAKDYVKAKRDEGDEKAKSKRSPQRRHTLPSARGPPPQPS